MSQPIPVTRPFTVGVQYASSTLRASIFSVVSTLIAPILMTRLDQGKELLNMITDERFERIVTDPFGFLQYLLFLGSLFLWALANWYGSRVLLQREFVHWKGAAGAAQPFVDGWLTWFPRVLGLVGMGVIVGYLLFRGQYIAGTFGLLVTVLFALFVKYRRTWRRVDMKSPPEDAQQELRAGDRVGIWLSLSFSFVLLFGLAMSNFGLARLLGAPVILFLGLGSVVMFGSVVLTFLPLAFGWPSLVWVPIVLSLLFAQCGFNRNHDITPRLLKHTDRGSDVRLDVKTHFYAWLAAHDKAAGSNTGPIYLVAAEGGASRSAWWSAHVLSVLDYASDGKFSRDVYAVSGVSGGSLGVTTYVTLLAERTAREEEVSRTTPAATASSPGSADAKPEPILRFPTETDCLDMRAKGEQFALPMQSECFVGRDFLSTTLGYLVFPDLFQRFVPFPVYSWDRSLGLEKTWEKDWLHLFGPMPSKSGPMNPFAQSIDTLYRAQPRTNLVRIDLPILFLNTTRAKAGHSVLQSPVTIPSTELDDLFDSRLRTRGLPLSAAVHNSARFPLVSPGGDVETREDTHWDAVVDGGYFENSGAATLAEFVRYLRLCPRNEKTECANDALLSRFRVLVIQNDPLLTDADKQRAQGEPDYEYDAQSLIRQEETLTPLVGLFNVRSARADSSVRFLGTLLPDPKNQLIYVRLKDMGEQSDRDRPSMSWYLNPASRRTMWKAVASELNRTALCGVLGQSPDDCPKVAVFATVPEE